MRRSPLMSRLGHLFRTRLAYGLLALILITFTAFGLVSNLASPSAALRSRERITTPMQKDVALAPLSGPATSGEAAPASGRGAPGGRDLAAVAPTAGMTSEYRKAPASGGAAAFDSVLPPAPPNPGYSTYQSSLTAGQVDDNAKFAVYQDYLRRYQGRDVRLIPVEQRVFVRVLDSQQQPVAGAQVQLFDGPRPVFDGRTMSDGRILFLPQAADAAQAQQFRAVIQRGQAQTEAVVTAGAADQTVTLADVPDNSGPVGLDIVFLLDTTGSMGDEIDAIKNTIGSIASRIEGLPGSSAPRFGLVAYRDQGDAYRTRQWDFADVQTFATYLDEVQADGGGDYPEDVEAGLNAAIRLPGWAAADSGRHLRMIILVGDAPPHLDYANNTPYPALLQDAAQAGIKIFSIGASGLADQGEYIFRQFAQVTQGQFVFLTYANGVSGAPGVNTDKQVSDYSVDNLDSLVVRLVAGELAQQTGSQLATGDPLPVLDTVVVPASGLAGLIVDGSRRVGAFVGQWSALLWLLGVALAVVLARRAPAKARAEVPAPLQFTLAPAAKARTTAPAETLAASLAASAPVGYAVAASGHPTAPLPPL